MHAAHAAVRAGWFAGGVLFIDLHGYDKNPVQPGQALDALLRALGVRAENIPPTAEERASHYRSALGEVAGPVLLVADNASSEAQVVPLMPGVARHRVLVTSRHTLAQLGARLVEINVLDQDASIALLEAALHAARPEDGRVTDDRQAARKLASLCGGLPLALQITAALLTSDSSLTVTELAGLLEDERDRLQRLSYDDGTGTWSVAAAFGLSHSRLDDKSARLFRLLAVAPGPDSSTEADAILAGLPSTDTRALLSGLARAHLIEPAASAGRWRMHDLVRLYAQRLSEDHAAQDGRNEALTRYLQYWLEKSGAADRHVRALPDAPALGVFAGQTEALAWLDDERASLIAAVSVAAATGHDQAAVHLPIQIAEYLDWRRRFDDKVAVTAAAVDSARRLGDQPNEAVALTILGNALTQLGRFDEAITAHQDAAAVFTEMGDRGRSATALGNLGLALVGVRRFDDAITAHNDAAAVFEEIGDRHGEGTELNNLALALSEVGRFDEAIIADQDAAAIFKETGDRRREGIALNNLGSALEQARRFHDAIAVRRQAIDILRQTGDRHVEAAALTNLGSVLGEMRRFDEAIAALRDAAAIYQEIGDRHGEGAALSKLGAALRAALRFPEAIGPLQDATAILHETGDASGEVEALGNLGPALTGVDRIDEAVTALRNAIAIFHGTGDTRRAAIVQASLHGVRASRPVDKGAPN